SEVEPERLEALLFDAADPAPVDLDGEHVAPESAIPSRVGAQVPVLGAPDRQRRLPAARRRLPSVRLLGGVRPRFWLAAAVAAVALGAALLLVPTGQGAPAAAPGVGESAAATSPPPLPVIDRAVLTGDDPVAAALALAAARDECRAARSAECLGAVLEPGSALLESDVAALDSPVEATVTGTAEDAAVQRTGDAAMVTFPAGTLLLLRVEGEWRLRDVFAAKPPSG
ncbi:MAG TPA: hypothetical protein VIL55_09870, partial [Naasia sp.]